MARHGIRSFRVKSVLSALALAALPFGAARPASAGDPPTPDAQAAATAAAIETANLRAKTKLELARILDREGRTEEALAALLEADRILADAARLAAEATAPSDPRRGPRPPPSPRPPSSGGKPFLLGPVVPGPATHPVAPRLMPRRDPVAAAVGWLLRQQDSDGGFGFGWQGGTDPAPVAGRRVAVTAAATLALAEVAPDAGNLAGTRDEPVGDAEAGLAMRCTASVARAVAFLVAGAGEEGPLAASTEDHCMAAWAVASSMSRLGPRLIAALPKESGITGEFVERALVAALRRALAAQDPATGLLSGVGTGDARFLGTLAFLGFLHEVEPLPAAKAVGADLRKARSLASLALRGPLLPADLPSTGAGRAALSLLREDRTGLEAPLDGMRTVDATHLLYGTVSAFSLGSEAEWDGWWKGVLVPAMNAQAFDVLGGTGSFPPVGDPLGRTHATALSLLAWLYPDMEWRAPASGS